MAYEINADRTRVITDDAGLGCIPCYEGEVQDGRFEGRHVGVFGDLDDARRWLAGDDSALPLKVY